MATASHLSIAQLDGTSSTFEIVKKWRDEIWPAFVAASSKAHGDEAPECAKLPAFRAAAKVLRKQLEFRLAYLIKLVWVDWLTESSLDLVPPDVLPNVVELRILLYALKRDLKWISSRLKSAGHKSALERHMFADEFLVLVCATSDERMGLNLAYCRLDAVAAVPTKYASVEDVISDSKAPAKGPQLDPVKTEEADAKPLKEDAHGLALTHQLLQTFSMMHERLKIVGGIAQQVAWFLEKFSYRLSKGLQQLMCTRWINVQKYESQIGNVCREWETAIFMWRKPCDGSKSRIYHLPSPSERVIQMFINLFSSNANMFLLKLASSIRLNLVAAAGACMNAVDEALVRAPDKPPPANTISDDEYCRVVVRTAQTDSDNSENEHQQVGNQSTSVCSAESKSDGDSASALSWPKPDSGTFFNRCRSLLDLMGEQRGLKQLPEFSICSQLLDDEFHGRLVAPSGHQLFVASRYPWRIPQTTVDHDLTDGLCEEDVAFALALDTFDSSAAATTSDEQLVSARSSLNSSAESVKGQPKIAYRQPLSSFLRLFSNLRRLYQQSAQCDGKRSVVFDTHMSKTVVQLKRRPLVVKVETDLVKAYIICVIAAQKNNAALSVLQSTLKLPKSIVLHHLAVLQSRGVLSLADDHATLTI